MDTMFRFDLVDYIGSGMKKMFPSQVKRGFPLPEYRITDSEVEMTLTGHPISEAYDHILYKNPDLPLEVVFALDSVQKRKPITKEEEDTLRNMGFINGRSPNLYLMLDKNVSVNTRIGKYDDLRIAIITYVESHDNVSRQDIESNLLSNGVIDKKDIKDAVKYVLKMLVKSGKLKRTGETKSAVYNIRNDRSG